MRKRGIMKELKKGYFLGPFLLLCLICAQGCITGAVKDTSGNGVSDVDVIAFANCTGAGCEPHKVEVTVDSELRTGYYTTTNTNGQYFYDPYAEVVAPEDAMLLSIPSGDEFMSFSFSKSGYEGIWLNHTPEFQKHDYEGTPYYVAEIPDMYLCGNDEPDSDGDNICDSAEAFYGTDPLNADTDGDGASDSEEVFGNGTPVVKQINTLKILHANVNCSNFETSKNFYMMLGFTPLIETDVDVSDPAEAAGLNLPPYQLHAAPMSLSDGYIIDLIQWTNPYDPSAPYSGFYHLGLGSLSLTTTNLAADMAVLDAHGITYAGPFASDRPAPNSQLISFRDPDGTWIEVIQLGNVPTGSTPNSSGETYITGSPRTNINCSNYESSRSFYEMLGFAVQGEVVEGTPGTPFHLRAAVMTLPQGPSLNLEKFIDPYDPEPPYAALNHIGIARVAIETEDLDADVQMLKNKGVQFYSDQPITPSGPFGFLRYICFEDPDGTVIELVEYN